jgi:hypothetical protein
MKLTPLDAYLSRLEEELRKHGLADRRVIEEARDHLVDSIRSGVERGLSTGAAEHEAFTNFGSPATVAAAFVHGRKGMDNRLVAFLNTIASALRRSERATGHYHDVGGPSSVHVAVRLKRPWRTRFERISTAERDRFIAKMRGRGKEVSAFEADPRERLIQFLRDFGQRRLASSEALESLTLLEDTTTPARRGGRYLAAFSGGTKMVWTVALTADGGVSFDGTSAPA